MENSSSKSFRVECKKIHSQTTLKTFLNLHLFSKSTPRGFQLETFPPIKLFFEKLAEKLNSVVSTPGMEIVFKGANVVRLIPLIQLNFAEFLLKKQMVHFSSPFQRNEDLGHALHTDSSFITLNTCLGSGVFSGGELVLSSEKCRVEKGKEYPCKLAFPELEEEGWEKMDLQSKMGLIYKIGSPTYPFLQCETVASVQLKDIRKRKFYSFHQKSYTSLLHRGEQPHFSTPTVDGTRVNLVLFFDTTFHFPEFQQLSSALKRHVLTFADEKTICSFRLCSKEMKSIAEDDYLWKQKYEQVFGKNFKVETPKNEGDYFGKPGIVICEKQGKIPKNKKSWRLKYIDSKIQLLKSKTFRPM